MPTTRFSNAWTRCGDTAAQRTKSSLAVSHRRASGRLAPSLRQPIAARHAQPRHEHRLSPPHGREQRFAPSADLPHIDQTQRDGGIAFMQACSPADAFRAPSEPLSNHPAVPRSQPSPIPRRPKCDPQPPPGPIGTPFRGPTESPSKYASHVSPRPDRKRSCEPSCIRPAAGGQPSQLILAANPPHAVAGGRPDSVLRSVPFQQPSWSGYTAVPSLSLSPP